MFFSYLTLHFIYYRIPIILFHPKLHVGALTSSINIFDSSFHIGTIYQIKTPILNVSTQNYISLSLDSYSVFLLVFWCFLLLVWFGLLV